MKKDASWLLIISSLLLVMIPVANSNTLSDWTKGISVGMSLGLMLVTLMLAYINHKGISFSQSRFGKWKNRLLRSK
ncbi:hypothetical protein NST99_25425 [Paenibacillus sp. FSL L8-0470]|uniref:hypothetical protein n=1 Tax=unclassified Paenibacillus TaxID=185978 RepID=UPI0030FAB90E